MEPITTKQQFFDIVARHLLTQGKAAKSDSGKCSYRGECGLKCAIGCVIPDELYSVRMEGSPVIGLMTRYPQLEQFIPDAQLAYDLQIIHDLDSPVDWKTRLGKLVRKHDLSPAVVDEFA